MKVKETLLSTAVLLSALASSQVDAYAVASDASFFQFNFQNASANGANYGWGDMRNYVTIDFVSVSDTAVTTNAGNAAADVYTSSSIGGPFISSLVQAVAQAGDGQGQAEAYISKTSQVKITNHSDITFDSLLFNGFYSTATVTNGIYPVDFPIDQLYAENGIDLPDPYWVEAFSSNSNTSGASYEGSLDVPYDYVLPYSTLCSSDDVDSSIDGRYQVGLTSYESVGDAAFCGTPREANLPFGMLTLLDLAPGETVTFDFSQSARAMAYNVPEPAPVGLLAASLVSMFFVRRRKQIVKEG